MPISYLSSTLLLLKGLFRGKTCQLFFFQFLLIASLTISLACDPSDLPKGTRVTAHGPVLKVLCEPGLQAFEMTTTTTTTPMPTTTSNDKSHLLPTPTKKRFARFICMYGTSYQRIKPDGVDSTLFFCADKVNTECDDLEYSSKYGHLVMEGTVAIWQPVSSNESQRIVLYCLYGTWYQLNGESLPQELIVKHKEKKESTALLPTMATATATTLPNAIEKNLGDSSEPVLPNLESPEQNSTLLNPFHLTSLYLPPFLLPRTTATTTPKPITLAEHENSQNTYFPQRDIIVIAQSISLALHDSLHRCTRIAFYCMLVIGIMTLLIGLVIFFYLCRRRALLAADAKEAQVRLKHSISVV
ncbi:unnamed protein product [Rodentolepis nana]|uniref:Sushi domain-containing protein n=1 Tax=Rodentolepis nana TaxID=102285 RepID=A0A0R3TQZ1_RODNA|nr:unnamed protein product [Rodentolepis nana]